MLNDEIFKANDIRGVVAGERPEWDVEGARRLGAAFVELTGADALVLGRDMRQMGEELAEAFTDGARRAGCDVTVLGLTSTDQLWYASGASHLPGVQFTASHNPVEYNGVKFCLSDARPVPPDFMTRLRDLAPAVDLTRPVTGNRTTRDSLPGYVERLHSLVPVRGERRIRCVVDAGNGMAGHTVLPVLEPRDVEVLGLYLDLDGSFPNHPANPLEPANLVDARRAVVDQAADLGLVFDGDADRCFIIDELGEVVDPSVITAMIADAELEREPGAAIVVNTITSRCVDDVVAGRGELVRSRVGHTYVKALMAEHDGVFGGEHSAHYYFRDFWSADTGMLAALHVLEHVRAGEPLSELARRYGGYVRSGELNSRVADVPAALGRVARAFEGRGEQSRPDGLMIETPDWWVNLRPSNTEPLLRLNVEARDEATMAALRDEVLGLVRTGTDPHGMA
ncbi:phosphomannomutase/phosphoglucomutase [uncultured Tessaracoccus sp.]|uniref:phosphomannomutase/phosphoglucomutase n=1 Tax=uncultured Tessaracoccus sp. TaxID=905023 RepID=UPI0025E97F89|nr:phosphomannomutase/phosphoglucomutase [uncultured Tessaracoccus sp.]